MSCYSPGNFRLNGNLLPYKRFVSIIYCEGKGRLTGDNEAKVVGLLWQRFSRALDRPFQSDTVRHRIHVDDELAAEALSLSILEHIHPAATIGKDLTIVCIGTDRSTGDALGPLVGARLSGEIPQGVKLLGTLDEPVHAANLRDVLRELHQTGGDDRYVVAVDACLGRSESVGYVSVKPGPLHPGTGVNKSLPPVGNCHIMGVVNVGGFMEYFVLQNTRLSLVMRMADTIADGLSLALEQWQSTREAAVTQPPLR